MSESTHRSCELVGSSVEGQARSSLGRTILRNTLFVSSGGGLIRLLSFAYTIYYVRHLGEHVYGQYATVLALCGLFSIFVELGTTQYVERSLAQDRSRLAELVWMLIIVRLILALAGIFLITGLVVILGYEQVIILAVFVFTISFILAALLAPLMAIFTSHERYDLWTSCQVIGQVGTIALGMAVLSFGGGLVQLVASGLVSMVLQIAYCLIIIQRNKIGPLGFTLDTRRIPDFLRASLPFALTSLALTISFNVDTFLLSLLQPNNVVGWYSAAYRLVPTIVSILGGFLTVITPSLARTYISDQQSVRRWTRISIKWLSMFGLPVAAGTSILASQIINQLYGASFAPAGAVLAIISCDIPLRLFNAFAGNVTAAIGLERPAWRIFMTGSLLGVVLYAPAIMLFGMLGAAVITVLTDCLNAVLFFRLLGKHLEIGDEAKTLLRIAAATGLMGLLVWMTHQSAMLPVSVAVGVASYVVLAFVLGLVDQGMVSRVTGLLTRVKGTP
jgi:O-antigen/teichoic acid export membrane protein